VKTNNDNNKPLAIVSFMDMRYATSALTVEKHEVNGQFAKVAYHEPTSEKFLPASSEGVKSESVGTM